MDPKNYQNSSVDKSPHDPIGYWYFLPSVLPPDLNWSKPVTCLDQVDIIRSLSLPDEWVSADAFCFYNRQRLFTTSVFSQQTQAELFMIEMQSIGDERTPQDGNIFLDKQAPICDNVCSNQGLD
jgi:hypothetical protein